MRAVIMRDASKEAADQWRHAQLLDLVHAMGAKADVVIRRKDRLQPDIFASPSRFAVLPPDADTETADSLLEAMAGKAGYDLAISAMRNVRAGNTVTARFWICDHNDDPTGAGFALALATLEADRERIARSGTPSLRLPLRPPAPGFGPGPMVGWVGTWTSEMAEALSETLGHLAERTSPVPGGILFAGEGAGNVRVPEIMRSFTVITERASPQALGLALLPTPEIGTALTDVLTLTSNGCPVILGGQAGAEFENRWHLPTATTPRDLAEMIIDWGNYERHPQLVDGVSRTHEALTRDAERMEAYVRTRLADAVSGAWAPA